MAWPRRLSKPSRRHASGAAKRYTTKDAVLHHHDLVDIAPAPIFTGLEGLDDRVVSGVEVLGGMFVLRGIAAADVPALGAEAQVYPRIPDF